MAHNIDSSNGRDNIAYLGSRNDVWHRLGTEMAPGMSIDDWAVAAGLNWRAVKTQAHLSLPVEGWQSLTPDQRFAPIEDRFHLVRSDTARPLGYVSDVYQPVQPRDVLDWFQQYISVDPRFQLDVAGSLKGGEIIWATATFNGGIDVAGDKHVARLLMTTTFDGSGATTNQGTMTRVVCNNTLNAALGESYRTDKSGKRAVPVIRTRHNTRFLPQKVSAELGAIAESFESYATMGNAMVNVAMSKQQVSEFFKQLLEIPFDAKKEDISGKRMNAFTALSNAYSATLQEGTPRETQWAALNAVTRFADHEKHVKGGETAGEARFLSSQFGSGAQLKAKAVELLSTLRLPVAA